MKKPKSLHFKLLFIVLFAFLWNTPAALAQEEGEEESFSDAFDPENAMDKTSVLKAGLAYSQIGDKSLIGLQIQPELSIGKLGIGLDLPIMLNLTDQTFYMEPYQDGVGVLRMIRYVSWGVKKRDPFYIRVGELSGAYLGYGILMNNYTNSISLEKRKFGVSTDILIKKTFGVEAIYSDWDFTSMNLLAVRPYVRPLGFTGIPIVKTLDVGFSYVADKDETKIITDAGTYTNEFIKDGMSAWAVDAGVQIFNNRMIHLAVFGQYGVLNKLNSDTLANYHGLLVSGYNAVGAADMAERVTNYNTGKGASVGLDFKFKFLGELLQADARIERLWYQDYFMPQFFDALYEMNKDAKVAALATTEKKQGIYGSLGVTILSKLRVGGGLMIPDKIDENNQALIKLNLDASQLSDKFIVSGTYYKGGLKTLKDAFIVDETSLLTARFAYKINRFLAAGVDYNWTFATLADGTFEATNHITPYFGLNLPFGGNNNDNEPEEE